MASYIGAAVSRVDGRAKVTGAAKYAAEFNAPGMVFAHVVASTITKGRIKRIDTSSACSIEGVLDVPHASESPGHGEHRQRVQR